MRKPEPEDEAREFRGMLGREEEEQGERKRWEGVEEM